METIYKTLSDNITSEERNFEQIGIPCRVEKQTKTSLDSPYPNKHRDYEFLCILSGEGTVTVDLNSHTVKEGDIIAVNPDNIHSVLTDGTLTFICFILNYDYLVSFAGGEAYFTEKISSSSLYKLLKELLIETTCNLPFRERAVLSAIDRFLVILLREFTKDEDEKDGKTLGKIKKAIGYMSDNLSKDFSLDDVADYCGVSKYHLCRQFGTIIGQTPVEYLKRLRCERAKGYLSVGRYSVSEVAVLCGFSSPSYFASVFKSLCGVSPTDFKDGRTR